MKLVHALCGIAVGSALSFAAVAEPIPLPSGLVNLSDNDAEYLINSDGSICGQGGDCLVQVGDRLRGIFDINTIEGLSPPSPQVISPFNGNELTGIFDLVVTSATQDPNSGLWTFTFAPSGTLGANTAVQLYYDPAQNYQREDCTIATCEASATGGSLWASFGFGTGSFWFASGVITNDISQITTLTSPNTGGTYNASLDILANNTGYTFSPKPCLTDISTVCASGSLVGTGGANTPFNSFSNVDFTLLRVPEPGSLALLGGALAILGFVRRKQR